MAPSGFLINGAWKDLSHLNGIEHYVYVNNKQVKLIFTFLNHCYTDEKGDVEMPFKHERRYWSEERYQQSLQLPTLLAKEFTEKYAIAYRTRKGAEQYHYMEIHDYAIFFDISIPAGEPDTIKIKVVSAYNVDAWGRSSLPKGKRFKLGWVLSRRIQGFKIL